MLINNLRKQIATLSIKLSVGVTLGLYRMLLIKLIFRLRCYLNSRGPNSIFLDENFVVNIGVLLFKFGIEKGIIYSIGSRY